MKTEKKLAGKKHRIHEERKSGERIGLVIIVAILVTIIFVSGLVINSMLKQPTTTPTTQIVSSSSEPKAAIIDQLSLTSPNQTFIQTATNTLRNAGYTVDYYPGENVTVELYRNLPTHGYKIVILRAHSAATGPEGEETSLKLFTCEGYSKTKYVSEQLTDKVVRVAFSGQDLEKGIVFFGVSPLFVTQSMQGEFEGTVIIMMGCGGLVHTSPPPNAPPMAEAFIGKGAKVYFGWSGSVIASHTDQATTRLLQLLVAEKQNVKEAVGSTNSEVGPDPASGSHLNFYPPYIDVEEYKIP